MEEYIERLNDLCKIHGVIPTKNLLNLREWEFGSDAREVQFILNNLSELFYEKCDCWEHE